MGLKDVFNSLSSSFWSESVWLPPNTTWSTYKECANNIKYAQFNDLYYSFITAIFLLLIRYVIETYIFSPLGLWLGIKVRKGKPIPQNDYLEKIYQAHEKVDSEKIKGIAKQLDLSEHEISIWFRLRAKSNRSSTLKKFTESAWRCLFYSFTFIYGIYTLYDKSWTWDSMECFKGFPHHSVSNDIWWYYNFELGFYLSLMVSQFFDIKRKDFWQMFIHHIVTTCLLIFSWACNLHRIGSLVLVIHDFADIPLEGSKICRYLKAPRCGNVIFSIFSLCWIYSRLGLLPTKVIMYSSYYALSVVPMFPAYYIFNFLLCALQMLHIIWTWLILRIAYNAIFKDGVKDLRESDESSSDEMSDSEEYKTNLSTDNAYKNGLESKNSMKS